MGNSNKKSSSPLVTLKSVELELYKEIGHNRYYIVKNVEYNGVCYSFDLININRPADIYFKPIGDIGVLLVCQKTITPGIWKLVDFYKLILKTDVKSRGTDIPLEYINDDPYTILEKIRKIIRKIFPIGYEYNDITCAQSPSGDIAKEIISDNYDYYSLYPDTISTNTTNVLNSNYPSAPIQNDSQNSPGDYIEEGAVIN